MSTDTVNNGVIVGEPLSTLPTISSTPSGYPFPRPLSPSKPDGLKANPHPYPIRTTSTAVLSRSNSSSTTPHQYQYYVPQSPGKESSNRPAGTRHGYSKSLSNVDGGPRPLPVPPTLFGLKNRSTESLSSSSSSSGSSIRSEEEEEEEEDVFGVEVENDGGRKGRRRGGKVRGIVASFEERGGPEDDGEKSTTGCVDSTPKRTVERRGTGNERAMMKEGLTSTTGTVYDDTVKIHSADVAYSTVTASSIRYGLPLAKSAVDQDNELSVEELLALVSDSDPGSAGMGASAWEREDGGVCTVKRVGELTQDSAEGSQPPNDERRVSRTERELELVQEMSETREMVRALSARVASVEARVGEMEIAAGELEIRGRQLMVEGEGEDEDRPSAQGQSLPARVVSMLYRTVSGFARAPKRERSGTLMWYKKSWACYLLFLGLGACAFVLREAVKRGRRTVAFF